MEEIKQADPAAVVVNGYYSGYLGEDMSLDGADRRSAPPLRKRI